MAVSPGRWWPGRLWRRELRRPDGRTRLLRVPDATDQAQARALHAALQPAIEATLGDEVWGYRPGRSCSGAVDQLCQRFGLAPSCTLLKADLRDLFPSLPLAPIQQALEGLARQGRIDRATHRDAQRAVHAWAEAPGRGLPQGPACSPVLANLALHGLLDQPMRAHPLRPRAWVRYADDLVLADPRPPAALLGLLDGLVRAAGLQINPTKTACRQAGDGRGALPVLGLSVSVQAAPGGFCLRRGAAASESERLQESDPFAALRRLSRWPGPRAP